MTSFRIQCSNCTDAWYKIPLYLFFELAPITILYVVILVFHVNVTSAPMTCFIMYSQLITILLRVDNHDASITKILFTENMTIRPVTKVILTVYGVWNLDFFRDIFPPFCISSSLKSIHVSLLGYISVFYPLCLIILNWICVELHDRNFRPFVWLWRPLHRCFVRLRRGWNTKSDIINVFASFLLLSYNKLLYQTIILISCSVIHSVDRSGNKSVLNIAFTDHNIRCGLPEFVIPTIIISITFNGLPLLLLFLYPFKVFSKCTSKLGRFQSALNIFVEKFYSCYRDGLDGGRDMRYFSILYFLLRALAVTMGFWCHKLFGTYRCWFAWGALFSASAALIAFTKPYKVVSMNLLDTLLLVHISLVSHAIPGTLQLYDHYVIFMQTLLLAPFAFFCILIVFHLLKVFKFKRHFCFINYKKWFRNGLSSARPQQRQQLIQPNYYGT